MNPRQQLRQDIRRKRRALTRTEQLRAAKRLHAQLCRRPEFIRARHVALYLPNDGEIDPRPLLESCWKMGKKTYLPVLHPILHNRLWFVPFDRNTKLVRNIYKIEEKKAVIQFLEYIKNSVIVAHHAAFDVEMINKALIRLELPKLKNKVLDTGILYKKAPRRPPWALDLVLLPLVAFDANGNRMGMGGGYYDRTFSFKSRGQSIPGPKLIGLAHELQRVDRLPVENWDIPLAGIISDQASYLG